MSFNTRELIGKEGIFWFHGLMNMITYVCCKIPCEKQSSWARILADSDDCATFAYISSKCLETETIKCSGPLRNWTNTTLLLETAVIYHHLEDPSFELENDEIFFFKKLVSLLYVRMHRRNETSAASLLTSSTSIASIPWSLQQRSFMREKQRRKRRLRDKQATYGIGETVVVLAAKGLL
ncbi:uncharacterized protein BDW70DRAFT_86953 [Aspergillus foveolatus]|uniref:uncharacterized protein n=1 Tax=Aspergillus foveolatus TaxID=210207 RepID=UPI003CCCE678